jgi:uncharacterized tellurite resistance protein B-like protein
MIAIEMARADGDVHGAELEAIRDFLLHHVPELDAGGAERILQAGLAAAPGPGAIEAAIETIRAVASEEQQRLIVAMFGHVARADGGLDGREVAFMERIGRGLGLSDAAIHKEILKTAG